MSLFVDDLRWQEETMWKRCVSCRERKDCYGRCKECYEAAFASQFKEIEELKAKLGFLRLLSPLDYQCSSGFTDVVLVASADDCENGSPTTVEAHKAVLVSRSPVFKAMLENKMEERRSGTIKISDVSYDVLQSFVHYLYTAEASLDEQMASELLVLAEKYQVTHLKAFCEKFMTTKLNWDNAVSSFVFARQHNAKHLLEAALSMITDNMDNLRKGEEYMKLVEKEPHLVIEIHEAYLTKQSIPSRISLGNLKPNLTKQSSTLSDLL